MSKDKRLKEIEEQKQKLAALERTLEDTLVRDLEPGQEFRVYDRLGELGETVYTFQPQLNLDSDINTLHVVKRTIARIVNYLEHDECMIVYDNSDRPFVISKHSKVELVD